MVCSRYPKECRHYETNLKRRCFKKLRSNVWENKTKWVLLERAEDHHRIKLLHKYVNLWLSFLNERYRERINGRAADALYEEKLKLRGILGLKRNVERRRALMRICRNKYEWSLKYKCWHEWKHYVEKRVKVGEVKALADRIRKERLRVRFFYLWLFRFNEMRSLQNAYNAAGVKYDTKLKEKYLKAWKAFIRKQTYRKKMESIAVASHEDKLKEKFLRSWKRYLFQRKRYRFQMKIIQNFYQNYLLENYINRWRTIHKQIQVEKEICNWNSAVNFHERRLLERSFATFLQTRERRIKKKEQIQLFRVIVIRIYLNLWLEKQTEKNLWNNLEAKAAKWREEFLLGSYLVKLYDEFRKRVEEREEMANVIKYSNAILTHRAFRGWCEVTERKITKKIQLENASRFYSESLVNKSFHKWKKYVMRRSRKKMAAGYNRLNLLSRALRQWETFLTERKQKLTEAENLQQKLSARLTRKVFELWKNDAVTPYSKFNAAILFCNKLKLSRAFATWKKETRVKIAYKNRYNRNETILNAIIIKNTISRWFEMVLVKRNLRKKLEGLESVQGRRLLGFCYDSWHRFVEKRVIVRRNVGLYLELRGSVIIEQYLVLMSEAVVQRKEFQVKEELARRTEEKLLKRRYLSKWLRLVSWKRERLDQCLSEERKSVWEKEFEVFTPPSSGRRKPMIPGYLKEDLNFEGSKKNRKKIVEWRCNQSGEIFGGKEKERNLEEMRHVLRKYC